jgi:hypothetical protein
VKLTVKFIYRIGRFQLFAFVALVILVRHTPAADPIRQLEAAGCHVTIQQDGATARDVSVWFDKSSFRADLVGQLAEIDGLRSVRFDRVSGINTVADAISNLQSLQRLTINNCPLNDDSLASFARLKDLRMICMTKVSITGKSIDALAAR